MILRPASPFDAEFLFALRTDPATAEASLGPAPVWWEHLLWLSETLANPHRRLSIVERAGHPLATVRLDLLGADRAEVSITVDPASRRTGVGLWTLAQIEPGARARGIVALLATIKPTNVASMGLFTKAGYTPCLHRDDWEKRL